MSYNAMHVIPRFTVVYGRCSPSYLGGHQIEGDFIELAIDAAEDVSSAEGLPYRVFKRRGFFFNFIFRTLLFLTLFPAGLVFLCIANCAVVLKKMTRK